MEHRTLTVLDMDDEVKVTIIGVPYEHRKALKLACLNADTSVSGEIRDRLPQIVREIEGRALSYEELASLLMAVIGVLNMALSGMEPQARAALQELNSDLTRFRHQIKDELHTPR